MVYKRHQLRDSLWSLGWVFGRTTRGWSTLLSLNSIFKGFALRQSFTWFLVKRGNYITSPWLLILANGLQCFDAMLSGDIRVDINFAIIDTFFFRVIETIIHVTLFAHLLFEFLFLQIFELLLFLWWQFRGTQLVQSVIVLRKLVWRVILWVLWSLGMKFQKLYVLIWLLGRFRNKIWWILCVKLSLNFKVWLDLSSWTFQKPEFTSIYFWWSVNFILWLLMMNMMNTTSLYFLCALWFLANFKIYKSIFILLLT